MHIDWEMVIALSAVATIVGSAFLFVLRLILAPLKMVIQENTKGFEKAIEKLENHEVRLTVIETIHKMGEA